jgi:hypothetical protein
MSGFTELFAFRHLDFTHITNLKLAIRLHGQAGGSLLVPRPASSLKMAEKDATPPPFVSSGSVRRQAATTVPEPILAFKLSFITGPAVLPHHPSTHGSSTLGSPFLLLVKEHHSRPEHQQQAVVAFIDKDSQLEIRAIYRNVKGDNLPVVFLRSDKDASMTADDVEFLPSFEEADRSELQTLRINISSLS